MTVDEGIKKNLQRFIDLAQRFDGMDINKARSALYSMYGDTYFYEYFLMEDLIYM